MYTQMLLYDFLNSEASNQNDTLFLFQSFLLGLQLGIAYDKFIRTTDPKHEAIVKEFYSKVLANGDIYRADYEGLYCVNCEEYKVIPHI